MRIFTFLYIKRLHLKRKKVLSVVVIYTCAAKAENCILLGPGTNINQKDGG